VKKRYKWAKIFNPSIAQSDRLPQVKYAQNLTREKKVDMAENLSPKHCPKPKTSTSETLVCRFEGGIKVASLKS